MQSNDRSSSSNKLKREQTKKSINFTQNLKRSKNPTEVFYSTFRQYSHPDTKEAAAAPPSTLPPSPLLRFQLTSSLHLFPFQPPPYRLTNTIIRAKPANAPAASRWAKKSAIFVPRHPTQGQQFLAAHRKEATKLRLFDDVDSDSKVRYRSTNTTEPTTWKFNAHRIPRDNTHSNEQARESCKHQKEELIYFEIANNRNRKVLFFFCFKQEEFKSNRHKTLPELPRRMQDPKSLPNHVIETITKHRSHNRDSHMWSLPLPPL